MRETLKELLDVRRSALNDLLRRAGLRFQLGRIWPSDQKTGGRKGFYPPEITDASVVVEIISALKLVVLNTVRQGNIPGKQVVMDNQFPGITLMVIINGTKFLVLDEYRIIYDTLMTEVMRGWLNVQSQSVHDAANNVLKKHLGKFMNLFEIEQVVPMSAVALVENSSISNAQTRPLAVFLQSKVENWESLLASDEIGIKNRILDVQEIQKRYAQIFPNEESNNQVEFDKPKFLSGVYDVMTWMLFIQHTYVVYLRKHPEYVTEAVREVLGYYQSRLTL